MTALGWLLAFGATWRLTLLVVADKITDPIRQRLWDRYPIERGVGYLISCPWCASWWVGLAVVGSGLAWSNGWGWQLVTGTLTASVATGALSSRFSPDG